MSIPNITNAVYNGGTTTATGNFLKNYDSVISVTNSKTFTEGDTPIGERINGATLVENSLWGAGIALDGITQRVDPTSWSVPTGAFAKWGTFNPNALSSQECLFAIDISHAFGNGSVIAVYIFKDATYLTGSLQVVISDRSGPILYKIINTNDSVFINGQSYQYYIEWDGINQPSVWIDNVLQSNDDLYSDAFTSIQDGAEVYFGASWITSGYRRHFHGVQSNEGMYLGTHSATERGYIFDNTVYYKKVGGVGPLVYVSPTSSTDNQAVFNDVGINDVLYVFNKDGNDNTVVVSGGTFIPQKFTIELFPETIKVNPPLYGNKSTIDMPVEFAKKSNGLIDGADDGATYDKYISRMTFLLNETEASSLLDFYRDDSRENVIAITPPEGYALTPFTPLRGNAGPFVCNVLDLKQSSRLSEPYGWYRIELTLQNIGAWPAYSLPTPIRAEGNFAIGTVTGLRCPESFTPAIDYGLGAVSQWGNNVSTFDRAMGVVTTRFTINTTGPKMAELLDYLTTTRFINIQLTAGLNTYIYGNQKGDNSSYISRLLNENLVVTQIEYNRYTLELQFQWRSTV